MSSSCFDMISDKGGGRHGRHVCVRSLVGSLLSLLTLTHRRQGCAGRLPRGGGGRAEARGGGKGGGVTGFPPGDAPRDEEVAMLCLSSRWQTRVRDGQSSRQRGGLDGSSSSSYEDDDANIRRRRPARPRRKSVARSGPTVK
jgi:hypothetical protein